MKKQVIAWVNKQDRLSVGYYSLDHHLKHDLYFATSLEDLSSKLKNGVYVLISLSKAEKSQKKINDLIKKYQKTSFYIIDDCNFLLVGESIWMGGNVHYSEGILSYIMRDIHEKIDAKKFSKYKKMLCWLQEEDWTRMSKYDLTKAPIQYVTRKEDFTSKIDSETLVVISLRFAENDIKAVQKLMKKFPKIIFHAFAIYDNEMTLNGFSFFNESNAYPEALLVEDVIDMLRKLSVPILK